MTAGGAQADNVDDWRADGRNTQNWSLRFGRQLRFHSHDGANQGLLGRCQKNEERRRLLGKRLTITRFVGKQVLQQLQNCDTRQKHGNPAVRKTGEDGSFVVQRSLDSLDLDSYATVRPGRTATQMSSSKSLFAVIRQRSTVEWWKEDRRHHPYFTILRVFEKNQIVMTAQQRMRVRPLGGQLGAPSVLQCKSEWEWRIHCDV